MLVVRWVCNNYAFLLRIGVVVTMYHSWPCGGDTEYFVFLLCTEGVSTMHSRYVLRVQCTGDKVTILM